MKAPRFLIVDDDVVERSTLVDIFRLENYQVTDVADGNLALDELSQGEFDLLLLDLHLVGMSGIELLERVSAEFPRRTGAAFESQRLSGQTGTTGRFAG